MDWGRRLLERIQASWFLLTLVACLALGGLFGHSGPPVAVNTFIWLVQPSITTAIVLFLMAFSLDASKRSQAIRRPLASLWGCVLNMGVLPLLAWPIGRGQMLTDFELGLLVTAATPCTLATASVFTRWAGGNDAVSLMTTLITNVGCVILTPLWLQLYFGNTGGFDAWMMVRQLALSVVLPTILGQLAQIPRAADAFVTRHRRRISLVAQWIVLLLVTVAAVNAGRVLSGSAEWPSLLAVLLMVAGCVTLHLLGLWVGWYGSQLLRLPRSDVIAVAIAGSQKTLPVGLMIVTSPELTATAAPFITFPLVVYHAAQLLIDATLADHWRRGTPPPIDEPAAAN